MARALSQIISELDAVYQPQKNLYNQQISGLDPAMQAEDKGLEAQKQDSFGQITQGANRRGLLFSGIPLEEQARYVGQSYLPAVANLKAKYAQQRFNLQDALAKINQDQYGSAYDMYNKELAMDEARRAAASGGGGSGGGGFNFGGNGRTSAPAGASVSAADQDLYNRMFLKPGGGSWSDRDLVSDYNRTLISARNGNAGDIKKIQFYHTFKSGLFGANQPSLARPVPLGTSNPQLSSSLQSALRPPSSGPLSALGLR